mgnify:CR=1 FL=1
MRLILAILVGKLIAYFSKTLHFGGGSAAPGLYALKIEPKLVEKLIQKIPQNIVITGTNGKTTTARMIAHFAKESNLKVIRNHTGSNLERGIASALIQSLGVNLRHTGCVLDRHLGIWELDEATFNSVAPKIKPDLVVFLNVFRDQLDRYGEIDSVVKNWCEALKDLPKDTLVLLNGDDTNTLKLKNCFKGSVETFGVEGFKIEGEAIEKRKTQPKLDFEAKNVKQNGLNGSSFSLIINQESLIINLPLPGIYHIYDALAAIAAASNLPLTINHKLLTNFQPAFGRFEKLPFGSIFLIKNPAGATQVFETINPNLRPNDRLLLTLNDNLADGTDVSWIWDANFELLTTNHKPLIICSGARATDLAVRLKYAGFDPKNITVEPNLENALEQARKGLKGALYILPTYTALLEIQKILVKMKIKQNYWREK